MRKYLIDDVIEFLKMYGFDIIDAEILYYKLCYKGIIITIHYHDIIIIYTPGSVFVKNKFCNDLELFKQNIRDNYPIKTRKLKYAKIFKK